MLMPYTSIMPSFRWCSQSASRAGFEAHLSLKRYMLISRDRRMSKASAFRSGRLGNLKVVGSNAALTFFLNPGRVKPMTIKLILVAP